MTRAAAVILAALVLGCSGSTGTGGGTGGAGASGGGSGGGAGGGSSAGGGAGGGSTITADQACTNFATAYCNKLNSCYPFALTAFYGDIATCVSRGKLNCLPPLALSTTGSSPAFVNGCVAGLNAATCLSLRQGTAGCKPTGSGAAGTTCGAGSQCASGYCRYSTNSCGVCAAKVSNGGNCGGSADCLDGSACVNAVCVAKRALGAACSAVLPCSDVLYCRNGQCTAVATTAGTICDPNDADSCDFLSGLFCNNSNVCAQITSVSGAGAACGVMTNDTYVDCSGGGTCRTNGGVSGTCVPPAADGQSCNPNNDLNCADPAACEGGVCKLYNPASCL